MDVWVGRQVEGWDGVGRQVGRLEGGDGEGVGGLNVVTEVKRTGKQVITPL